MNLIPVVVFSQTRDVIFGYIDEMTVLNPSVKLERAKSLYYWSADVGGASGLANGPGTGAKVGKEAPFRTVQNVAGVLAVTDSGAKAWEAATWVR